MIYLDLDQTLVFAVPAWWADIRALPGVKSIFFGEDEFYAVLRPRAKELIAFCRGLSQTKILTMGSHFYAWEINAFFDLGFQSEDLVGRDVFVAPESADLNGEIKLQAENVCPNAVLVDNQRATEKFAQAKMKYLGITPDRYISIREYNGSEDQRFAKELEDIKCLIRKLKS